LTFSSAYYNIEISGRTLLEFELSEYLSRIWICGSPH